MRPRMIATLAALLLFSATPALSELPTDGMGVFFDMDAATYCLDHDPIPGFVEYPAYFVLTNASTSEPHLVAWEARLETDGNPLVPLPDCWQLHGGLIPLICTEDWIVDSPTVPLAITNPVTVVAAYTVSFIGLEVDPWVTFSVGRVTGSTRFADGPGYVDGAGVEIPGVPIHAPFGETCAWINHPDGLCATVPNEDLAWGAVKALYD